MKTLRIFFAAVAFCSSSIAFSACDKNKTATTPSSRFTLNEAEAFDQQTKLTWARCSVGTTWKNGKCAGNPELMNLSEAKEHAQKIGGGWRVPSIEELYSIIEQKCSKPAVNSAIFPNVKDLGEGAPYWSTTKIKEMPLLIYYVDFLDGGVDGHTKGFSMAVRLVRGGK